MCMQYDLQVLAQLDNFIDNYLKEQYKKYANLEGKDTILDKIAHINRAMLITSSFYNMDRDEEIIDGRGM